MCILNGLKIGTSFLQEMNGRIVWSRNPTRGVLTTKRLPEAWRASCETRVPRPADNMRGYPYNWEVGPDRGFAKIKKDKWQICGNKKRHTETPTAILK